MSEIVWPSSIATVTTVSQLTSHRQYELPGFEILFDYKNENLAILILYNLFTGGVLICFKNDNMLVVAYCNGSRIYIASQNLRSGLRQILSFN